MLDSTCSIWELSLPVKVKMSSQYRPLKHKYFQTAGLQSMSTIISVFVDTAWVLNNFGINEELGEKFLKYDK